MRDGVKTALISVSDKAGIVEFAKELSSLGVRIISTGGTAKKLSENGVSVVKVEEVTGFPECLDGRIKTLHPNIHAGILAQRNNKEHLKKLEELNIEAIDLVVVNLYPFKETIAKENASLDEAIENIDIGGPTMIRAAAKNFRDVAVVVNPEKYGEVLREIKETGTVSLETKKVLCSEAFEHTAFYDTVISNYLREKFGEKAFAEGLFSQGFSLEKAFPKELSIGFEKVFETSYGENPHQKAGFFKEPLAGRNSLARAEILNGKELSFNNLYDAHSALEVVREFQQPCAVIVKHNNPCGAAVSENINGAFKKALESDPQSAFGGIICINRECGLETAKQITSFFNEVVIAPSYGREALEELKTKKNLRVLRLEGMLEKSRQNELDFKKINGGLLVQEKDFLELKESDLKFASEKKPSGKELQDLLFAWKIVKHVKSNAIVLARDEATVGIGAGQMSRVNSVEIAIKQATGEKAKGSVMASDAFLPFKDSIDKAADAGITAVIETGGSLKDDEVIKAACEKGIALVFTGVRHFKH